MHRRRFIFILLFGIFLYAVVLLRLSYMQIFRRKYFSELSKKNYVRSRVLYPKRGNILDRRGEKIAYDTPRYILFMDPQKIEDLESLKDTINILNELYGLDLDEDKLKSRLKGYEAIYIKSLDTQEELDKFYNNAFRLPGVYINIVPQRVYPHGEVCAHITGYVGLPTKNELSKYKDRIANESLVGRSGIERSLEDMLLGRIGKEEIMVNAVGKPVKSLGVKYPQNGNTVVLSIDLRIQKIVFDAFKESGHKAGAVIVLHAKTGEVLGLLSYPSFDPNKIKEEWEKYNKDKYKPLFNRALLGRYPPASVIKPALAISLLMNGVSPYETVFCKGKYRLGNRDFYCWKREGHGSVNIKKAIYQSCDTYFYHFGYYKLGYERIEGTLRAFSYAQGIPFEMPLKRGFIPTPEWKRKVLKARWYGGDTVNMSIGQGYMKATLMEQTVMMMGIANNGVMYKPTIIREIQSPDGRVILKNSRRVLNVFRAPQEYFAIVKEALRDTVTKGTAVSANSIIVEIAGKTGTAQIASVSSRRKNLPYNLRDHAWFVGFAPYRDPLLVIGVLVEHGGSGGSVAAPIARKIIERIYMAGIDEELM